MEGCQERHLKLASDLCLTHTFTHSDSLPPERCHLLNIPRPFKTAPPAGDIVLEPRGFGVGGGAGVAVLHIQTITLDCIVSPCPNQPANRPDTLTRNVQGQGRFWPKPSATVAAPLRCWAQTAPGLGKGGECLTSTASTQVSPGQSV